MNESHIKMPPSQRAKQFAPFDAVVGLRAALREKERIIELPKTVSDDLCEETNRVLKTVKLGDTVTIFYYSPKDQRYIQITGCVSNFSKKIRLIFIGNTSIPFDDIYQIAIN